MAKKITGYVKLQVPAGSAEAACVQLGATRPEHQPGGDRWRVMLDPAGHPFCLALWQG